jgi:hypothetical protein
MKSELKTKYNKVVDDYIVSLQNTSDLIFKMPSKSEGQKVNYKDILRQLKSIYEERKDTKNAALVQKKINEAANL